MKNLTIAGLFAGLTVTASVAHADPVVPHDLHGSDTLFGVVTNAITQGGLDGVLHYLGGGSGTGENGLLDGSQGIAPMSRALTGTAIDTLTNLGIVPQQKVIGLDGISLFVKSTNVLTTSPLGIDKLTIRAIYSCSITDWANVPGSAGKTGTIVVYARNGLSGTTDTFKTLIGGLPATVAGNANWGPCVHEVDTTDQIADNTSADDNAIGFAGLSGGRAGNKALAVSADGSSPILPTEATIQDSSYPLNRRLFINFVSGGAIPTADEQALLDLMLDRSFLDPILVANEFITCAGDCNN
jgi:phosphate transport system substrate-binding protein